MDLENQSRPKSLSTKIIIASATLAISSFGASVLMQTPPSRRFIDNYSERQAPGQRISINDTTANSLKVTGNSHRAETQDWANVDLQTYFLTQLQAIQDETGVTFTIPDASSEDGSFLWANPSDLDLSLLGTKDRVDAFLLNLRLLGLIPDLLHLTENSNNNSGVVELYGNFNKPLDGVAMDGTPKEFYADGYSTDRGVVGIRLLPLLQNANHSGNILSAFVIHEMMHTLITNGRIPEIEASIILNGLIIGDGGVREYAVSQVNGVEAAAVALENLTKLNPNNSEKQALNRALALLSISNNNDIFLTNQYKELFRMVAELESKIGEFNNLAASQSITPSILLQQSDIASIQQLAKEAEAGIAKVKSFAEGLENFDSLTYDKDTLEALEFIQTNFSEELERYEAYATKPISKANMANALRFFDEKVIPTAMLISCSILLIALIPNLSPSGNKPT